MDGQLLVVNSLGAPASARDLWNITVRAEDCNSSVDTAIQIDILNNGPFILSKPDDTQTEIFATWELAINVLETFGDLEDDPFEFTIERDGKSITGEFEFEE